MGLKFSEKMIGYVLGLKNKNHAVSGSQVDVFGLQVRGSESQVRGSRSQEPVFRSQEDVL
jgi:hypothetical protein